MLCIIRQVVKARGVRAVPAVRTLTDKAPESFYNETEEVEKEIWDIKLAKATGGVLNLTTGHPGRATEKLGQKFSIHDVQAKIDLTANEAEVAERLDDDAAESYENRYGVPAPGHLPKNANITTRTSKLSAYVPPEYMNHSLDWGDLDNPDQEPEELQSLIKRTDERSMPIDKQGLVACPGRRQRRGTNPVLKCHLIDLDTLHYTDTVTLNRFLAADSEILGKKLTGLCSKCQRKVANSIKRARNLGLLSHLGAYRVVDADPHRDAYEYNFHRSPENVEVKVSKTIL